ncbi:MAG: hypothetical protein U0796_02130 [Gemmatales bacterium]
MSAAVLAISLLCNALFAFTLAYKGDVVLVKIRSIHVYKAFATYDITLYSYSNRDMHIHYHEIGIAIEKSCNLSKQEIMSNNEASVRYMHSKIRTPVSLTNGECKNMLVTLHVAYDIQQKLGMKGYIIADIVGSTPAMSLKSHDRALLYGIGTAKVTVMSK